MHYALFFLNTALVASVDEARKPNFTVDEKAWTRAQHLAGSINNVAMQGRKQGLVE